MVCTPRQPGAGANHSHTHGEGAKPLRSFPSLPKGTPMNTPIPVIVDGQAGIFAHSKARVATLNVKAKERLCLMDARIRTLMAEPEEGAATAEYAVVLVAATGFAAVLVAILKSDAIKTLLTNIIKQALKVG
ncbi:DUF4244 domain-containing protein [Bifidobacterium longum]|uniref:DUF4244 domain-containing protein n=1 Tax=Bifidobacterium longum TaxID=216816 RepID=A0A6A2SVS9_BIFLN|nr:DUF4244 domain-containing protein [Bifidobacterium longum]KAB7222393.1 DUF4244 domain-containing protein [Bifidobacterium longum]KAB7226306.1 DUF4244 domain-containing protein [Bifidobacterium longum]KAB7227001.1 DUF4244 domain-containing protein [Bifidobacterium longum]KAB7230171.1 DUF4244 domain-containing protein [Bifidobacterium longum]